MASEQRGIEAQREVSDERCSLDGKSSWELEDERSTEASLFVSEDTGCRTLKIRTDIFRPFGVSLICVMVGKRRKIESTESGLALRVFVVDE